MTGFTAIDRNRPLGYVFEQSSPANVWGPIAHNLGFFPNFSVEDSAGNAWDGVPTHIDENTMLITFLVSFAGKARLS